MATSIALNADPAVALRVRYLLRIADTALIHAQRLAEWCGHAPVLEEDIALSNIGLDLIGQARALLTHAGRIDGQGHDEDALAFLREERDYLNPVLVELPNAAVPPGSQGRDFGLTVVRNTLVAAWFEGLWTALAASTDAEVAAIAGKAVKEARYHRQHAGDWLVRLGDGTDESHRRMQAAVDHLWRYTAELFEDDEADGAAVASGLGPASSALQPGWTATVQPLLDAATLTVPKATTFRSHGRRGLHSEHMGHLLTPMQHLQRSFPGGVW